MQYIGGVSGSSTISGAESVMLGSDTIAGNWVKTDGEFRKGGTTVTKNGSALVIDTGDRQLHLADFDETTNHYGITLLMCAANENVAATMNKRVAYK